MILTVLIFSSNCTNNTKNEIENVNGVIYRLIEADNEADIRGVLNSYTDSVEFYPTGREFTKGIKAVQTNYEQLFKENKLSLTTKIIETKIFGNQAIVSGLNRGVKKSIIDCTLVEINDKYIAILVRNKNGEWKIDKLVWGIIH